jgi:hypothetical protein
LGLCWLLMTLLASSPGGRSLRWWACRAKYNSGMDNFGFAVSTAMQVVDRHCMSLPQQRLVCILISHANSKGDVWVSKRLAEAWTGSAWPMIRADLDRLTDVGLIRLTEERAQDRVKLVAMPLVWARLANRTAA